MVSSTLPSAACCPFSPNKVWRSVTVRECGQGRGVKLLKYTGHRMKEIGGPSGMEKGIGRRLDSWL